MTIKAIGIWASQNNKKAIALIVVFEVLKCTIGFDIGHNFLPTYSTAFIELAVLTFVFLLTFVQTYSPIKMANLSGDARYRFRLKSTGVLFAGSLLLSILLGNHFRGLGYSVNSLIVANAAVNTTSTSELKPPGNQTVEKKATKKHKMRLFSRKATTEEFSNANYRIAYVLMFLLSLLLGFGGLLLTCNLACGGWAVLSVITLLATLGVVSGGIYFLIKAFQNPLRINSQMPREEKKKEHRKFFLIWGILAAALGLYTLISSG